MEFSKTNFIERIHCPNCNCMYIIIDNEIFSCPGCEINFHSNGLTLNEDALKNEVIQLQF